MGNQHDLSSSAMSEATLLGRLLAREHRPNVLVECGPASVSSVSRALMRSCREPHQRISLPCAFEPPASPKGTLLLENVEALTPRQQIALHDWLSTSYPGVQVVSVAGSPLAMSVRRGEFLEALFYRLNVVHIDGETATLLPPTAADQPQPAAAVADLPARR